MHPILHRVARVYGPLGARNRLVEGAPPPPAVALPPRRRLTLIALLSALAGRQP